MSHELTAGPLLNAVSGILMVAIGIFVARLKGQTQANRAFAFFSVAVVGLAMGPISDNTALACRGRWAL